MHFYSRLQSLTIKLFFILEVLGAWWFPPQLLMEQSAWSGEQKGVASQPIETFLSVAWVPKAGIDNPQEVMVSINVRNRADHSLTNLTLKGTIPSEAKVTGDGRL